MSTKSNKQTTLPKLPAEQIRKYIQAGHWPPPDGIIVLPEIQPSQEEVNSLLDSLAGVLPPQKRNVVEKAKENPKKG